MVNYYRKITTLNYTWWPMVAFRRKAHGYTRREYRT